MANIDTVYLEKLVTRFRGYKSPNDTQKLIIALGEKQERSDDDNKKLAVLMRAEKKSAELMKARAATNLIINAEKAEARKLETRKKVIWGAALKTASRDNPDVAQLMLTLFSKYVSDKDKSVIKADIEAITTLINSDN